MIIKCCNRQSARYRSPDYETEFEEDSSSNSAGNRRPPHSSFASASSSNERKQTARRSCFGGVLALDGRDGRVLWEASAPHEVYALNCEKDLTHDGVPDCVAAGRFGAFLAINSVGGNILWTFDPAKCKPCTHD